MSVQIPPTRNGVVMQAQVLTHIPPDLHKLFGVIAGVLIAAGFMIYVVQAIRGIVNPQAATWIVSVANMSANLVAQHGLGGFWSTFGIAAQLGASAVLIKVALSPGRGKEKGKLVFSWGDVSLLVIAGTALIVSLWFHHNAIGMMLTLFAGSCGMTPTWLHAWRQPHQESHTSWLIDAAGGPFGCAAALLATGNPLMLAITPAYMALQSLGVNLAIGLGRRRDRRLQQRLIQAQPVLTTTP